MNFHQKKMDVNEMFPGLELDNVCYVWVNIACLEFDEESGLRAK